jgi:pimeloyl-ACP methyl ester carboxylesterase
MSGRSSAKPGRPFWHPSKVDTVQSGVLDVAYERHGDRAGWQVVLLHGFPYDVRCYDEVVAALSRAGADVVVPYLRGYGPTRFRDAHTPRSGQQAALAHDLRELLDALCLDRPIVAGFDWGGRAACLVAALWPERIRGLITVDGYNVQDIAAANTPAAPEDESRYWYQYQQTEQLITAQPMISVPTVVLDSEHDGLGSPASRVEHATHSRGERGRACPRPGFRRRATHGVERVGSANLEHRAVWPRRGAEGFRPCHTPAC